MAKKALLPQSRRHILVYDEDWEFLEAEYGTDSASKIGVSAAVRTIIHGYVVRLRAKATAEYDRLAQEEAEAR